MLIYYYTNILPWSVRGVRTDLSPSLLALTVQGACPNMKITNTARSGWSVISRGSLLVISLISLLALTVHGARPNIT